MRTWHRTPRRCSPSARSSWRVFPSPISTDLTGKKRRPALVVSRHNERRGDLVVCFITSVPRTGPDMASIGAGDGTGLKRPSVVRFDKIATLDRAVIAGRLGAAPPAWLTAHRGTFFDVFGFGSP